LAEIQSSYPGTIFLNAGYEGQFAVVDTESNEIITERICWLWRFVSLYWGGISQTTESLQNQLFDMVNLDESKNPTLKQIRSTKVMLNLLEMEAFPENFCGDSLDTTVYGGVWNAWNGDDLVSIASKQADLLDSLLTNSRAEAEQTYQRRMSIILFIFTLLTLSSTLAALIDTLDYSNLLLGLIVRIFIIFIGTILFGITASMYVYWRMRG
jgi:hypothetical protein